MAKKEGYDFDLICLGGGSAGTTVATLAQAQGLKTALVEPGPLGGQCCQLVLPLKALLSYSQRFRRIVNNNNRQKLYQRALQHKNQVVTGTQVFRAASDLANLGISCFSSFGKFIDQQTIRIGQQSFRAKQFVIATGARPRLPIIAGLVPGNYLTPENFLKQPRLPESAFVIGGGRSGYEIGQLLANFKTEVFIAETSQQFLPKTDSEIGRLAGKILSGLGGHILTGCQTEKISRLGPNRYQVDYQQNGQVKTVVVNQIILAAGRQANCQNLGLELAKVVTSPTGDRLLVNQYLRTNQKQIWALGDVIGSGYHHWATHQANLLVQNLKLKKPYPINWAVLPKVIFGQPEIAFLGWSENRLKQERVKYQAAISPVAATGRAMIDQSPPGFVKLLVDQQKQILGASIISNRAAEMIQQITLAARNGLSINKLATNLAAFPTYSEAVRLAALQLV